MQKINKMMARRLFNQGEEINIVPCKVPCFNDNKWIKPFAVHKMGNNDNFDSLVNSFEYYNCCNELGRYGAYYVENNVKIKGR